jgi:hypothetical protein
MHYLKCINVFFLPFFFTFAAATLATWATDQQNSKQEMLKAGYIEGCMKQVAKSYRNIIVLPLALHLIPLPNE